MKQEKKRTKLAASIINIIVVSLLRFSLLVSVIGSIGFAEALKKEYASSTFRMADTAALLVNGDSLARYLEEGEDEEYLKTQNNLNKYCEKMWVSLSYVIVVDQSDYGRFQSVFNLVNNGVDKTEYTPWELGFQRDTTNETYRQRYKRIYEGKSEYETVYRLHITDDQKQHITTLVPVKNTNGEVVGILCVQRPISDLRNQILQYLVIIAVLAVFLSALSAIIVATHNKKHFVRPITLVSEETMRFASGDMTVHKLGDVSSIKEIYNLASAIDKMEEDMANYVENLTAVTSEKERIGVELSIAGTIQENSIPNIFPAFPERQDFDIYASMTPAKEVGGDFYNFFLIDDDHLALIMADVSGKGVPAALFMRVSNLLISERARVDGTPAEVLTFVNNRICTRNKEDMFVTVWLGILEISTGKLLAANAGHDDPVICHKGGDFELIKEKRSLVVGAMSGIKYKDYEIQLSKGDKLFLYTDGVPEATDKDNKMFTLHGMLDALNRHKNEKPDGIIGGVNESINDFVGDAPQFDDLTMLCLELKENDNKNALVLDATNDNLFTVLEYVDNVLEANGCSAKDK